MSSAFAGGGTLSGVPQGAVALLAIAASQSGRPVVLLARDPERAYNDCRAWSTEAQVELYPALDTLPFDPIPPGDEIVRRRIGALNAIATGPAPIIVASPAALIYPTVAPQLIAGSPRLVAGAKIGRDQLIARLVGTGYRRVGVVTMQGDFAVRGGIVDLFPPTSRRPLRLEWVGDELESIRSFDVETQVSRSTLREFLLLPAREMDLSTTALADAAVELGKLQLDSLRAEVQEAWIRKIDELGSGAYDDGVSSIAPFLLGAQGGSPGSSLLSHARVPGLILVAGRLSDMGSFAQRHRQEVAAIVEQEVAHGELPQRLPDALFGWETISAELGLWTVVECERLSEGHVESDLGWEVAPSFVGEATSFPSWASSVKDRERVLVCTRQEGRVMELAGEEGLHPVELDDFDALVTDFDSCGLYVAPAGLSSGFVAPSAFLGVITDVELFGPQRKQRSVLLRGARSALSTSARGTRGAGSSSRGRDAFTLEFAPGDIVTHRDHGIGRFLEMRSMGDSSGTSEYMVLEFADKEKLYVPVAHLDRVDRYVGGADGAPALSHLGSGDWERAKRRVKERTEQIARELLRLYSRREATQGYSFASDSPWQHEVEAAFPFDETPDQQLVMEEIKRDMEASRPMDRLVCGDVGFGKTELALRAAFKAAVEGKQVAMLVPTTVLCQQHFGTFSMRLAPFPVTVRQLSRFVGDAEAERTLAGLADGSVDIVIGTHRLLQKGVRFHNLGLVILDEEQRFGVLQKERFKELRLSVDMLSLSATPIPRTLHMALASLRDLSVIQTPPEERQPVRTYVTAYDENLVRDVVLRELSRGGQVYYLHNRVQTIQSHAERLAELIPEARIGLAHGQMPETMLASVMQTFADGDLDILCCTTIIESGLDIPNVNTIIISDAHRLGLAQLYQLRGRVGRGGQRAYAYILYPPNRSLTEKADKRLEVVSELQELGSGFRLALKDLEIRGAGNLLGEEQHGEIAAVGLEVYNHLLRQAVSALQGTPLQESPAQVTVSLPLPAFIPKSYVTDERLRLRAYQDLAACTSELELGKAVNGLADRFGPLPGEVLGLVYSLKVRLAAALVGAMAVETDKEDIVISFPREHGIDFSPIVARFSGMVSASPTRLRLLRAARPVPGGSRAGALAESDWQPRLMGVLEEVARVCRVREGAGSAS